MVFTSAEELFSFRPLLTEMLDVIWVAVKELKLSYYNMDYRKSHGS